MKHGNFFKFVKFLLKNEYIKAREFNLLIMSGGTTGPSKKKVHKVSPLHHASYELCARLADIYIVFKERSRKIAEATALLEKGQISPAIFLRRIAYDGNGICNTFELDVEVQEETDSSDESECERWVTLRYGVLQTCVHDFFSFS